LGVFFFGIETRKELPVQVIQSQTSDTSVFVGKKAKSRGFGVSNDASLMSMLSTGFYGKPFRTMIQEIMFNAWDAHKMVNKTDKPIHIHLDPEAGLTIRDFGPGIHDDDMEFIYCVYGNSTKADDEQATGGFGLGSKSPFAFCDSFQVTSMHDGVKTIYMVNKVSDEADGKPGLDAMVSVPTTDSGLIVNIPFENGEKDVVKAYGYIQDLLYLSGVKANVYYDGANDNTEDGFEFFDSKHLGAGEYWLEDRPHMSTNKLYAVYGGVRYAIPAEEEYAAELEYLKNITGIATLYVGFGPSTLTPLPNREGLNMNKRCKEAVRRGLELCMERFQTVFRPLVHAYMRQYFDYTVAEGIAPELSLIHAASYKMGTAGFSQTMESMVPLNTDPTVWAVGVQILERKTTALIEMFTKKVWLRMMVSHFVRVYPDHKELGYGLLKMDPDDVVTNSNYFGSGMNVVSTYLASAMMPKFARSHYAFEQRMKALYPNDNALNPELRLKRNNFWYKTSRRRSEATKPTEAEKKIGVFRREPSPEMPDTMWVPRDQQEVSQIFMYKKIFLAKTASALNDTNTSDYHHFHPTQKMGPQGFIPSNQEYNSIPAYIVHVRKGAYDKAKELLIADGFDVIECDEPEKKVKVTVVDTTEELLRKKLRTDPRRIQPSVSGWTFKDPEDPETFVAKPDVYLQLTTDITDSYSYRQDYERPTKELVYNMIKVIPEMAMANTQVQMDFITKNHPEAISFVEACKRRYDLIAKDKYRYRNLSRYLYLKENSQFVPGLYRNQKIQKTMCMVPVGVSDKQFWDDAHFLGLFIETEWKDLREHASPAETEHKVRLKADPLRKKMKEMCNRTKVFDKMPLFKKWQDLTPQNKSDFATQLCRFLR
jgi:hypothetical protein